MPGRDLEFRLIVNAQTGAARVQLQGIEGDVQSVGTATAQAGRQARQGFQQVERGARESRREVSSLRSSVTALVAAFGVHELVQWGAAALHTADNFRGLEARIGLVTSSQREQSEALQEIINIAEGAGAPLAAVGDLYARIAFNADDLNASQEEIARTVQTVVQGLALTNTTGAEASSVIIQLSQAFGEGLFRGEEFNAVASASPALMRVLAQSLGVPTTALRTLAEQGRISARDLLDALSGLGAEEIQNLFNGLPVSVGRALENLRTRVTTEVAQLDKELSATQGFVSFVTTITEGVDDAIDVLQFLEPVIVTVAAAITSRLVVALGLSTVALAQNVRQNLLQATTAQRAAIALGQMTRAQLALNIAARAGQQALAVLGGASGLILLVAQLGLYAFATRNASGATEALEDRIRRLTDATQEATSVDLTATITDVEQRIAAIIAQQESLADRGIFPPALQQQVDELQATLAVLNQRLVDVTASGEAAGSSASGLSRTFVELESDIRKQIQSLEENTIELRSGAAGLVEYQLQQAGLADASEETQQKFRVLVQTLRQVSQANDEARESAQRQKNLERERAQALDELNKLQRETLTDLEQLQAEYFDNAEALDRIIQLYADDADVVARANDVRARLLELLERTTAEQLREQDVISDVISGLDLQIELARLSNIERERELIVRQAIIDAQEAGRPLSLEEVELLRQQVQTRLEVLDVIDQQRAAEEELVRFSEEASRALTDAITDFVASGFDEFERLEDFVADTWRAIVRRIVETQIVIPITTAFTPGAAGGAGGIGATPGIAGLLYQPETVPGGGPPRPGAFELSNFGNFLGGAGIGATLSGLLGNGSTASAIGGGLLGGLGQLAATTVFSQALSSLGSFAGPLGGLIGGGIGSLIGGLFGGKSPRIRVGGADSNIKVNDSTDTVTSTALVDELRISLRKLSEENLATIVDQLRTFDALIATAVGPDNIPALTEQLRDFYAVSKGDDVNLQEILRARLDAILQALDPEISNLVRASATGIEEQIARLQAVTAVDRTVGNANALLGPDATLTQTVQFLDDLGSNNETLIDTLVRVAASTDLYRNAQIAYGNTVDASSEEFVRMATAITDAAGGLPRAQQLYSAFFAAVFDPDELLDIQADQLRDALARELGDIGIDLAEGADLQALRDQLRALFGEITDPEQIAQLLEAGEALGALLQIEQQRAQQAESTLQDVSAEIRGLIDTSASIDEQLTRLEAITAVDRAVTGNTGLLGPDATLASVIQLLDSMGLEGESLVDTLTRLTGSTELYRNAQIALGNSVDIASEGVVRTAAEIVEAAGGLQRAQQLYSAFFAAVFDPDELLDIQADQLRDALARELGDIGIDLAEGADLQALRDQLRALFGEITDPEQIAQLLEAGEALGALLQIEQQRAQQAEEAAQVVRDSADAELASIDARRDFIQRISADIAGINPEPFLARYREIQEQFDANAQAAESLIDSEEALEAAHALLAARTRQLTGELIGSILEIGAQLFGGAQSLNSQLVSTAGSINETAGALGNLGGVFDRIRAFADSLLTDPNLGVLGPDQRPDALRQQLNAAISRGDFGAVEGLARQLAQAIRDSGSSSSQADAQILELRDLLLGLQPQIDAATRPPTAVQVGSIANDVSRLTLDAGRQAELAAQLIEQISALSKITGKLPFDLLEQFNYPIDRLIEFLGINVATPSVETVRALGLVAEELRVGLPELANRIGLNLGSVADQDSLLNQALRASIEGLTNITDEQRQQLLDALVNGDVSELERLTSLLPTDLKNELAPLLDGVNVSDVAREQARLLEDVVAWTRSGTETQQIIQAIMFAVNSNLGAIREALGGGPPEIPGFLRGGLVTGPTLATLAEDGRQEFVLSNPMLEVARQAGLFIGPAPVDNFASTQGFDIVESMQNLERSNRMMMRFMDDVTRRLDAQHRDIARSLNTIADRLERISLNRR